MLIHEAMGVRGISWGMDGSLPYQYGTRPPEVRKSIARTIEEHIEELGYTPEQTIFVTPHASCAQKVLVLDENDRLSDLALQPVHAPVTYCDLQPDDQTNIVESEGLFTFSDYLLMTKPGDCFFMLVMANTKRGRCIGMVHSGRKQIMRGVSESWIQPLLSICESPMDIQVVITPGLQKAHHTIKADYDDKEFGTVADLQNFFGKHAYPADNGGIAIDSETYLVDALNTAGIQNVLTTGIDTYEEQAKGSGYSSRYCRERGLEKIGNICFMHFGMQRKQ